MAPENPKSWGQAIKDKRIWPLSFCELTVSSTIKMDDEGHSIDYRV